LDRSQLKAVVAGQDAVLSAFGPRVPIAPSDKHLLRDFASALSHAMVEAEVKRVVVESTAFLFRDALLPPTFLLGKLLFPSVVGDATDMEAIFRDSKLDRTLIRHRDLHQVRTLVVTGCEKGICHSSGCPYLAQM
jgi:hypothetical protein